jgi:DNA invertase Pin-like site-specific DNA recombinase
MIYSYMRLSTNEDKQSNSFEVQQQAILDKCNELGLSIDYEFKECVSGGADLSKRRELVKLIDSIKKDDIIIIHKLDRLSRDVMTLGYIKVSLQNKGASLIICDNVVNESDPYSELMQTVIGAFASFEKKMIQTRIKNTKQVQKSKSLYLGGAVPYGYNVTETNGEKKLVQNIDEMLVVSKIKKLRNKNLSLRKIANELVNNNISNRNGKKFSPQTISNIISYH